MKQNKNLKQAYLARYILLLCERANVNVGFNLITQNGRVKSRKKQTTNLTQLWNLIQPWKVPFLLIDYKADYKHQN